jgi:hypothetical protein
MDFDDVVSALRALIGSEIAINITDERFGRADGYVADFSGTLTRVDDPIPGVDAPVHYFRLGDSGGFGLHEAVFKRARWETTGGVRALRVELGDVIVSIEP